MPTVSRDTRSPVNFDRPPVAEVACTVQFASAVIDDQNALNSYWPRIRDRYPNLSTQPPLPPLREEFGPAPPVVFQFVGPGSGSRLWLASQDQADLVQVQGDRLAYNWRKEPVPGLLVGDYPRYPHVRERFAGALSEFFRDADERGAAPLPTWCEIAYVNHVPILVGGERRPLSSIIRFVGDLPLDDLPAAEDTAFMQRYVLAREDGPYGRMYIQANPIVAFPQQEPRYLIILTVRGLVAGPTEEDIISFMDHGRDLITHTFREFTTDDVHEEWGLT